MSVTIGDVAMLRRLVQGDLRSDGVTNMERDRLERLCGLGLVEKVPRQRPHAPSFFYVVTAEGLEAAR